MSKRINLEKGDVFELTLPDGRFGYGVIVRKGKLKGGGTPYIAILKSAYGVRPDLAKFADDEVALAGWTMDSLIYQGRWTVISRGVPLPAVPFPNFKTLINGAVWTTDVDGTPLDIATPIERELLDNRWRSSALLYQDAFEASHGLGDWRPYFDKFTPAYARLRITRPIR